MMPGARSPSSASAPTTLPDRGVYGLGAPRLGEFFAQFPYRNESHSIADADYSTALGAFKQLYKTTLEYSCVKPPADLDPDTPGRHGDCAFVSSPRTAASSASRCAATITEPCWEIVDANRQPCSDPPDTAHLQTRGFTTSTSPFGDPFHPAVRGECIVN